MSSAAMLSLAMLSLASGSPLETTCGAVKGLFRENECCAATTGDAITDTSSVCPSLDELITYPAQFGNWTPCPQEEFYAEYSLENTVAPGYEGCVSEDDATPCGWYDYNDYDATTGSCSTTASKTTAIQTVRGGSPTMTADLLRLTGKTSLPTISFPMLPMTYPAGRDNSYPEYMELEVVWKKFMNYFGSELNLDAFDAYPTYGAEMGMVGMVAIKALELLSTTCNRNYFVFLEAPAYGYDWNLAIDLAGSRASSWYAGIECPCATTSTCNDKTTLTISQRGWAPAQAASTMPQEADAKGVMHSPTSTSADSPWFQTNVIPGNPIGRFQACKAPQDRCLCDGVYWYPAFVSTGTVMEDFKCYSWSFSITKIYSAQFRGGAMFISKADSARAAARSIWGKMLSIGNGLMSYMQVHGQIQIMETIMAEPYSSPTSWIKAFTTAQHEKWDVMMEGFSVCESAGILKKTDEQMKYFGAYLFSHMMPDYYGLSADIGAASSDFFKSVVGYDHYNYNWGWRGEDPANYGIGPIGILDFHRSHLFRSYSTYEEESRRLKLVCGDKDAKVSADFLSVNEWTALRQADQSRRRKLSDKLDAKMPKMDSYSRALQVKESVPRMSLVSAIKHAEMTDPHKPCVWEYGMPNGMCD